MRDSWYYPPAFECPVPPPIYQVLAHAASRLRVPERGWSARLHGSHLVSERREVLRQFAGHQVPSQRHDGSVGKPPAARLERVLARRLRSLAQAVGREAGHDPDGSIASWV
ncbi:hypothetical protein GCM10010272_53860 [Streptomyces lateritius]|nr:hypothetical protein GCM10010272_53860 [Streptomyces lateritius]